jgi:hypothetical protein
MKIKDLMHALQQHDAESLVFVNGYEGGACRVLGVHAVTVALNTHKEWYYGAHTITTQDGMHMTDAAGFATVTGLLLQGEQNDN